MVCMIYEKTEANPLENITWSKLGKQKAKKGLYSSNDHDVLLSTPSINTEVQCNECGGRLEMIGC